VDEKVKVRAFRPSVIYLSRQRPGGAKGVMFMTIEDETGLANVVVWPSLFEKQRRFVLGAGIMAINDKIQRNGGVVHLVAQRLFDLSEELASPGEREGPFSLPDGRGDEFHHGPPGPDPRDRPPPGVKPRDIFVPVHIDAPKVRSRNFQ
jgi:error-prone DNA polymerase